MAPDPLPPRPVGGGVLSHAPRSTASRSLAVVLALVVPGLGHAWAGRRARGVAYFALVGSAFGIGLALGGSLGAFPVRGFGALLATAATHAVLAPAILAKAAGLGSGTPASPSYEIATTYLVVAGVMNVLLAFDAWDVAGERKP